MKKRTAAQLLVETLDVHGADILYSVPGESYLAIADALLDRPQMRMISCRHEGGAGFMALADAKVTRKPGICIVSRAPGATNASIAVYTAQQDAAPFLLLVGQVARKDFGRRPLQDLNYDKTFSDIAKLVITVGDGSLISDALARAYQVAQTGTPGPVVIVLPEDMLEDDVGDTPVCGPRPLPAAAPTPEDIARTAELLQSAKRPVVIIGGAIDSPEGSAAVVRLAERWSLPVCTVYRRLHQFPNNHPNYAGYLGVRVAKEQIEMLSRADLVLSIGTRMGDLASQRFKFPQTPVPTQPLIHVYPDPGEIGRIWHPTIGVSSDPRVFVERLLAEEPSAPAGRASWIGDLNAIERSEKLYVPKPERNDGIAFGAVVSEVNKHLRSNAMVSVDAGNFQTWVTRHLVQGPEGLHLGTISAAMGGGVPGAVAAGLRNPSRQLICFIGDGGFLMNGTELATAVHYGIPVKIFVANNSSYGSIRWHQETRYPGRRSPTDLTNPDFAALARAFGAKGLRIASNADVEPAVREAMDHNGPVVVETITSQYYISAHKTLDDIAPDADGH